MNEMVEDFFPQYEEGDEPQFAELDSVIQKAYTMYCEEVEVPDKLFDLIVDNLDYMSIKREDGVKLLEVEQAHQFFEAVYYMIKDGDVSYLTKPRGLRVDRIVDIEEFIKSPHYMNQRRYIRPPILRHLIEAHATDDYIEILFCLRGDTIIPLCNGQKRTIKELTESGEKEFWVWGDKDGDVIPVKATNPACYGKKEIYRVKFTDGSYVDADPTHKFITIDGRDVAVRDLTALHRLRTDKFWDGMQVAMVWPLNVEEPVYCLTVPETGNFFVKPNGQFSTEEENTLVLSRNCGGIGIGKNYAMDLGISYMVYRLSCYHNPQIEFGLAPGSDIVFILQSKTYSLAKRVAFNQLGARLRESKYFAEKFPFDKKITSELRFPNNIYLRPVSSSDTAALGMNVFGGGLDEVNFLAKIEKSARADGGYYDQAEKMYNTLIRRMKSRFNARGGKIPGKLYMVSSAYHPEDFTETKLKERDEQLAKTGKTFIYVMKLAHWESYPPHKLSRIKFLVDKGDEMRPPKLLDKIEDAVDPTTVIEVPMDYRNEFERDIEAALRDVAGIPVGVTGKYIRQRDKLALALKTHEDNFGGKQLFKVPTIVLNEWEGRFHELLDEDFLRQVMDMMTPMAVHLDASVSEDGCSTGIGVSYVGGFKYVGRTTNYDPQQGKYVQSDPSEYPLIVVAGALEIEAPYNDEIDLNMIQQLLEMLATSLNVKWQTADQYQSAQILQQMRRVVNINGEHIKTGVISVDKDIAAYAEFKQAIRDERILIPNHPKLMEELKDLEFDIKKFKVVKGSGGTKDIADGVVGSAFVCISGDRKYQFKRLGQKRREKKKEAKRLVRRRGTSRDRRWYM